MRRQDARASDEGAMYHLDEHADVIERDIAFLAAQLPRAARVLDVGAGRGSFVLRACEAGFAALALDAQPEARLVWPRRSLPGVLADGMRLPFGPGSFDVVRMKEVIEHVQNPLALATQARRVLKPGGLLLAHVPTPYSQLYPIGNFWDDYTHVRPFSRAGLRRLVADAGLDLVNIEGYTSGRNPFERALGKVLGRVAPHIYLLVARA